MEEGWERGGGGGGGEERIEGGGREGERVEWSEAGMQGWRES